jgi:hypothetical protein
MKNLLMVIALSLLISACSHQPTPPTNTVIVPEDDTPRGSNVLDPRES